MEVAITWPSSPRAASDLRNLTRSTRIDRPALTNHQARRLPIGDDRRLLLRASRPSPEQESGARSRSRDESGSARPLLPVRLLARRRLAPRRCELRSVAEAIVRICGARIYESARQRLARFPRLAGRLLPPAEMLVIERKRGPACAAGSGGWSSPIARRKVA